MALMTDAPSIQVLVTPKRLSAGQAMPTPWPLIKADRLLIDERLGRRIARQRGLKVRGIKGSGKANGHLNLLFMEVLPPLPRFWGNGANIVSSTGFGNQLTVPSPKS
jgi:hypothetical protein